MVISTEMRPIRIFLRNHMLECASKNPAKNPAESTTKTQKPVRETQRNRRTHRLGSVLGGVKDSQVFTGLHRSSQVFTGLHRFSQVFTGSHRFSQVFTELHRTSQVSTDLQGHSKLLKTQRQPFKTQRRAYSKPSEKDIENPAKRTLKTQRGTHRTPWHEVVESTETFQRTGNFPAEQVHMVVSSESARFFQQTMVRVGFCQGFGRGGLSKMPLDG